MAKAGDNLTHDKMADANIKKSIFCHIVIPFAGYHEKGKKIQTGEEEEVKESRRRRRAAGEPTASLRRWRGGMSAEFRRSFDGVSPPSLHQICRRNTLRRENCSRGDEYIYSVYIVPYSYNCKHLEYYNCKLLECYNCKHCGSGAPITPTTPPTQPHHTPHTPTPPHTPHTPHTHRPPRGRGVRPTSGRNPALRVAGAGEKPHTPHTPTHSHTPQRIAGGRAGGCGAGVARGWWVGCAGGVWGLCAGGGWVVRGLCVPPANIPARRVWGGGRLAGGMVACVGVMCVACAWLFLCGGLCGVSWCSMSLRCSCGVTMVFLWSYDGVPAVFLWCYDGVPVELRWWSCGVPVVLGWCLVWPQPAAISNIFDTPPPPQASQRRACGGGGVGCRRSFGGVSTEFRRRLCIKFAAVILYGVG